MTTLTAYAFYSVPQMLNGLQPSRSGTIRIPHLATTKIGESSSVDARVLAAAQRLSAVPENSLVPAGSQYYQDGYFHTLTPSAAMEFLHELNYATFLQTDFESGRIGDGWSLQNSQEALRQLDEEEKTETLRHFIDAPYLDSEQAEMIEFVESILVEHWDGRFVRTELNPRDGLGLIEVGNRFQSVEMMVRYWGNQTEGLPSELEGQEGLIDTSRLRFNFLREGLEAFTGLKTDDDVLLFAAAKLVLLEQFGGERLRFMKCDDPQFIPFPVKPVGAKKQVRIVGKNLKREALFGEAEPEVITRASIIPTSGGLDLYQVSAHRFSGFFDLMPLASPLEERLRRLGLFSLAA